MRPTRLAGWARPSSVRLPGWAQQPRFRNRGPAPRWLRRRRAVSSLRRGRAGGERSTGGYAATPTSRLAAIVSATGGKPNIRPYSRVNCGTLS